MSIVIGKVHNPLPAMPVIAHKEYMNALKNYDNMDESSNTYFIKLKQGFIFDILSVNYIKPPYEVGTEYVLEIGFSCGKSAVKISYPNQKAAYSDYKLTVKLMEEYIDPTIIYSTEDLTDDEKRWVNRG